MTATFTFPSISHPTLRYVFHANPMDLWERRYRSGGFSDHFGVFDTLGDGETQHTPERVALVSEGADLLHSFVKWAQNNPEVHGALRSAFAARVEAYEARFLASVKPSKDEYEGRNYFSLQLRKQSKNPDKQHDDRWALAPVALEKTTSSLFRLWSMAKGNAGGDVLGRMIAFFNIQNWAELAGVVEYGQNHEFAETFGMMEKHEYDAEKARNVSDLVSGVKAVMNLAEGLQKQAVARHAAEVYERNVNYRKEDAAALAATERHEQAVAEEMGEAR